MSSKRQQTMAKMARERTVKERRAKKLEKKAAARAQRKARAAGEWPIEESTEEPGATASESASEADLVSRPGLPGEASYT